LRISGKNIICSDDASKNILEHEGVFYNIEKLSENAGNRGGKGGNSNVFKLQDPNDDEWYIVKFCNYPLNANQDWLRKRIYRFESEITALGLASKLNSENIIKMYFSGEKSISGKRYRFYVMEKGEMDLTEYLEKHEISIQQKVLMCSEILKGVKQLHDDVKVYHRDIKPDNIFFVGSIWKIGDLGLIDYRDQDETLDDLKEKIGPYGWLSPEVTNKMLCEGTVLQDNFSCEIDSSSDIFQLGKLFWYIFQGNIPIGQVSKEDFLISDNSLFVIIQLMLQHSKKRRSNMQAIDKSFKDIYTVYGI